MKLSEARSLEEYVYLHYIVRVDESYDPQDVADDYAATGVEITNVYKSAINGFSAHLYDFTIDEMREDDRILDVEDDGFTEEDEVVQYNAPWGLDRIDSSSPFLNNQFVYKNDGRGAKVYVVDSGIRADHVDFEDVTVTVGYQGDPNNPWGSGHGTGVACCVAGKLCGVAKRVDIVDVAVMNVTSDRINGMEWILNSGEPPHVVHMSFGVLNNSSLYTATANLVAAGFTCVASAGNDPTMDLTQRSPQNVPGVLVVAGSRQDDNVYDSSSEGATVDIIAPSQQILLADHTSPTAYKSASGTSYGAPMVAGAAAMLVANDPNITYQQVHDTIVSLATPDAITGLLNDETPNLLLNIEGIGGTIYADEDASTSITIEESDPGEEPPEPTEVIRIRSGVLRTKRGVLRTRLDT